MEALFYKKLNEDTLRQKCNSFSLSLQRYIDIIQQVKSVKQKLVKEPNDYKLLKRFAVLEVAGVEKLIVPLKENSDVIYFVHDEELVGILSSVHTSIGHGGRDRMVKEIKRKYKNITYKDIVTFLSVCEPCLQKLKREKKGVVVKPLLFKDLNYRCQVDLIDYQSQPDGEYKFVMVYQDHLTKFVALKALRSKKAEEVADELLNIFTLLGAPTVLQLDNGREFVNRLIENLTQLWPGLRLVHGKPRHSQSQGSVERANQDIENMLTTWMQENKTSHWAEGLRFVQFMKNKAHHSGIKRSPYEALFGIPVRLGLATSSIPQEALENVKEEGELEDIINSITPIQEQNHEELEDTLDVVEDQTINAEQNIDPISSLSVRDTEQNFITEALKKPIILVHDVQSFFQCGICLLECTNDKAECGCCGNYIHPACGFFKNSQNYIICSLCERKEKITEHRSLSLDGLEQQAKRMKKISDNNHPAVEIGHTVRVPIPEVDRGRGDARSILARVLDKSDEGFYKLGTRNGILKQLYARSQFSSCSEVMLSAEEVPDVEVTLRKVANLQSIGTGQGFAKCQCKTKCASNKCFCRKRNSLCTSKCHLALPCTNK